VYVYMFATCCGAEDGAREWRGRAGGGVGEELFVDPRESMIFLSQC
jgi:hypothetical protein